MRARFFTFLSTFFFFALVGDGTATTRTVDTLTDDLDSPAGTSLSLREAIRDSSSGDTILFAAPLNGGSIRLTRGELSIDEFITIDAMALAGGITLEGSGTKRVLSNWGTLTLRGLNIVKGRLVDQGGGVNNAGFLTMENCSISDCRAMSFGSAIYQSGGSITLRNCTITGNHFESTFQGRATISIQDGPANFINCTIANNEAYTSGGIYFGSWDTQRLTHCTITGNRSNAGAAVNSVSGPLRLQSSVLADNREGPGIRGTLPSDLYVSGTLQKIGQNFLSSNLGIESQFPAGPTVGTSTAPRDPFLSVLGFHGGKTLCRVPLSASPLLDQGSTSSESPSTDQRGLPRIYGAYADLGSTESQGTEFFPPDGTTDVTTRPTLEWSYLPTASSFTLSFGNSPESLVSQGSTFRGRFSTPELEPNTTYYWRIDSGAMIGPVQSFTTRDMIVVTKTEDENAAEVATVDGVSFREAILLANARPGFDIIRFHPDLSGQVVAITKGDLEITSELLVDGYSLTGGATLQGGHYLISSSTEFSGLTLTGGRSSSTGGAVYLSSSFIARNCTFAENRTARGGAIWLNGAEANCSLIHCTVTGNTAMIEGGGIYSNGGLLALENCIVAGNRALETSPDIRANASVTKRGQNLIGINAGSEVMFPAGLRVGTAASPVLAALAPLGNHVSGVAWHCPLLTGSPAIGQATALATTPVTDQIGQPRPDEASSDLGAVEMDSSRPLFLPTDGASDVITRPTLCWTTPGDSFEVFWGPDPGVLVSLGSVSKGYFQLPDLAGSTPYYWRVDATASGTTSPGMVRSFTTRGMIVVNTLADEDDVEPASGTGIGLREAIKLAESRPGADLISFASGLSGKRLTLSQVLSLSVYSEIVINASDLPERITLDLSGAHQIYVGGSGELTLCGMDITGSTGGGFGNAIRNYGATSLLDLSIYGNSGISGAAVNNAGGRLVVERCGFFANSAKTTGGALDLRGTSRVFNSTFNGNSATDRGGAIISGGTSEVVHCTISGNTSKSAGGIAVDRGAFTLGNSIILGNSATLSPEKSDLLIASLPYLIAKGSNLVGVNNGLESLFPTGSLAGTSADPLDGRLSPLANHGGATRTLLPLPGSPAIDSAITLSGSPASDQRGLSRPLGLAADIGAVEAVPLTLAILDTDADGMDDRLETAYGFVVGQPDGSLDADGDGSSNADELRNRTNPHDGSDLLRVMGIQQLSPGSGEEGPVMRLTWTTFPGLHYTIELSDSLNFEGAGARELDAGTAEGFSRTMDLQLEAGRDFLRVRRE